MKVQINVLIKMTLLFLLVNGLIVNCLNLRRHNTKNRKITKRPGFGKLLQGFFTGYGIAASFVKALEYKKEHDEKIKKKEENRKYI